MDRLRAVEQIADAAREAWKRAPDGADKFALHCLAWAKKNAVEKGNAFTAGHLTGIQGMSAHGATVSAPVASALFMASEALFYNGEVPDEQINAACLALDGLYQPEPARAS